MDAVAALWAVSGIMSILVVKDIGAMLYKRRNGNSHISKEDWMAWRAKDQAMHQRLINL